MNNFCESFSFSETAQPQSPHPKVSSTTFSPLDSDSRSFSDRSSTPAGALSASHVNYLSTFISALQNSYSASPSDSSTTGSSKVTSSPNSFCATHANFAQETNGASSGTSRCTLGTRSRKVKVAKPVRQKKNKDLSSMVDDDMDFAKQVVDHTSGDSINWKKISKKQRSTVSACQERWNQIKMRQRRFLSTVNLCLPSLTENEAQGQSQPQPAFSIFDALDNLVQDYKAHKSESTSILLPSPPTIHSEPSTDTDTSMGLYEHKSSSEPESSAMQEEDNIEDIDKFLS